MQYSDALSLTGLENIELELPTDAFFSIFKVTVPPFPTPEHNYYDLDMLGAGTYLAHTRKLTLIFTNSDPWYEVWAGPWLEEDEDGIQPRERANVCTNGLIIDLILTYAWHHNYLQHIPNITLKGDIQDWVKEKWYEVFAGTHPEQEHIANSQRINDIEHLGEQATAAAGHLWDPSEYYPPTCDCKINCSRLRGGVVEPEVPFAEEETMQEDSSPAEAQPWINKTGWE